MTVLFHTLGCKLNQAETEALALAFERAGFRIGRPGEPADVVIVNTCTVTARSDAKARHAVRHLAAGSPYGLVVLSGCAGEVDRLTLVRLFEEPGLAAVIGQADKALLLEFAAAAAGERGFSSFFRPEKLEFFRRFRRHRAGATYDPFALTADRFIFHSRAFLKIEDGCDNSCAFCRVPLARGPARSLDFEKVIEKIRNIAAGGLSEIVFTGVNISAYSSRGRDLADLLDYAVSHSRGIRFRLSSLEPEALSPRLIDVLAAEAICPHFHIPAQSGSDRVLKRMGRRCTREGLRRGLAALSAGKPGALVAGDFIVGFPGETDEDFEETKRAADEFGFGALHVFPFSPRPGTVGFGLDGRVAAAVVKERVRTLIAKGEEVRRRFLGDWEGRRVDVVLEKKCRAGVWQGSSAHSLKCLVEGLPAALERKGARVRAVVTQPGAVSRAAFDEVASERPEFIGETSTH